MIHSRRPVIRRPGISLIEVLLALAIFLITIAAIGQLVDLGTANALNAQFQSTATRLAQSKLAEAEAGALTLETSAAGTFDAEPEWSWEMTSSPTDAPFVYAVTVKVTRPRGNRTFEVSLTQMVMDPQQMGGAEEAQKPAATTAAPTTGGTP